MVGGVADDVMYLGVGGLVFCACVHVVCTTRSTAVCPPASTHTPTPTFTHTHAHTQVMADAADTALHTILTHCHANRVVVKICESLTNDKSPRLRTCCAKYLLQIIEEWDPADYERHVDAVETAIKAATGDALADVRATSRLLMGAYAYAFPDRANAMIRRVDGATADKLNAAVQQYPGAGSMVFPREQVDVPRAVQQHGGTTRRTFVSPAMDTARGCVGGVWGGVGWDDVPMACDGQCNMYSTPCMPPLVCTLIMLFIHLYTPTPIHPNTSTARAQ